MNAKMNETKRQPAVSATIEQDSPETGMTGNDALRLVFANGKELVLQVRDLSDTILGMAVMHGLKQKLVDAAAISRNPDTGRSATVEDKYEAVKTVFNRLLAGQWNAGRQGGGAGSGGLLFRALCRMYEDKSPESIREFLAGKSKADQAALRGNARVAAIIDEIKAEDAANGLGGDTAASDDLLAELEGDD
jgi:hypothetical protein